MPSMPSIPSMPAEQARTRALSRFQDTGPGHINCGQAVVCFALLRLGEDEDAIMAARYLGGGISGLGEVCGALNGAALALGMRDLALARRGFAEPPAASEQLKDLFRAFAEEFGACRCQDLTGYDLSTPEGMEAFKKSDIRSRCADYVSWAYDHLDPLLSSAVTA